MNQLIIKATTIIEKSNLEDFFKELKYEIGNAKDQLETDDDFAEAEEFVKTLTAAEKAIKTAKEKIFDSGELKSINDIFIDAMELSSKKRLNLNSQVVKEKQRKKDLMIDTAYNAVLTAKNDSVYPDRISMPQKLEFAKQIKGKKSLESMQDAVDRFAGVQIQDIQQQTNQINQKVKLINALIDGYESLFDVNYLIGFDGEVDEYINKIITGYKNKLAEESKPVESQPVEQSSNETQEAPAPIKRYKPAKPNEPIQRFMFTVEAELTLTQAKNQANVFSNDFGRSKVKLELIK